MATFMMMISLLLSDVPQNNVPNLLGVFDDSNHNDDILCLGSSPSCSSSTRRQSLQLPKRLSVLLNFIICSIIAYLEERGVKINTNSRVEELMHTCGPDGKPNEVQGIKVRDF